MSSRPVAFVVALAALTLVGAPAQASPSGASLTARLLSTSVLDGSRSRPTDRVRSVIARGAAGDRTAPTAAWKTPLAGATVSGTLSGSSCVVDARDNVKVAVVTFSVGGRKFDDARYAPYDCVWDTRKVADGEHRLEAVVTDTAGNTTTVSRTVTVANRPTPAAPKPAPVPAPGPVAPPAPPAPPAAPEPTVPTPPAWAPTGATLFRGDFETGDFTQWSGIQQAASGRASIVKTAAPQGRYAAKFEARQGEFTGGDKGSNRTELLVSAPKFQDPLNSERWYGWSTYIDPDFPTNDPDAFAQLVQWHRVDWTNPCGIGVGLRGDGENGLNLRVKTQGPTYLKPISRGEWHTFRVHVRWSTDAKVGFVEVWMDGKNIVPKINVPTEFRDKSGKIVPHYLKQGLYKSDSLKSTWVMHDGFMVGTSRGSVGG